ncbi:hypothetical protein [Psychrobacter immobilis]|uniref:hypothetical protein n=1 Tax=Psychrobacter immobilis TaxID=498 RepID=UPI0019198F25|nr:hypothetical protein [Psychrobacter immobilis]
MSDIQDPLIILQHRMQQRQILAMMGINQWVQPSSETINIADISAPTAAYKTIQSTSSNVSIEQPSIDDLNDDISDIESVDAVPNIVDHETISHNYNDINDIGLNQPDEQQPVTYSFDTSTADATISPIVDKIVQSVTASAKQNQPTESYRDHNIKVVPFDLQGGRYGNWVILVDIQALNNNSQKLWENITQALSITCETTSFPICAGMDTAELANASLAGYVFKIGRSEDIQVAALTALPEGLEHPNLTVMPALDEMLADSSLKRQFWEQLSGLAVF